MVPTAVATEPTAVPPTAVPPVRAHLLAVVGHDINVLTAVQQYELMVKQHAVAEAKLKAQLEAIQQRVNAKLASGNLNFLTKDFQWKGSSDASLPPTDAVENNTRDFEWKGWCDASLHPIDAVKNTFLRNIDATVEAFVSSAKARGVPVTDTDIKQLSVALVNETLTYLESPEGLARVDKIIMSVPERKLYELNNFIVEHKRYALALVTTFLASMAARAKLQSGLSYVNQRLPSFMQSKSIGAPLLYVGCVVVGATLVNMEHKPVLPPKDLTTILSKYVHDAVQDKHPKWNGMSPPTPPSTPTPPSP